MRSVWWYENQPTGKSLFNHGKWVFGWTELPILRWTWPRQGRGFCLDRVWLWAVWRVALANSLFYQGLISMWCWRAIGFWQWRYGINLVWWENKLFRRAQFHLCISRVNLRSYLPRYRKKHAWWKLIENGRRDLEVQLATTVLYDVANLFSIHCIHVSRLPYQISS